MFLDTNDTPIANQPTEIVDALSDSKFILIIPKTLKLFVQNSTAQFQM